MTLNTSFLFFPSKILPHLTPLAKHNSQLHGVTHWTRVHRYGLLLADSLKLSEEERLAIALFGWTHDLARTDDNGGNQHSIDGAKYIQYVTDRLFSDFPETTLDVVTTAIRYHSDGMNAEEALYELPIVDNSTWSRESTLNTIGCCWDADRLDLLRLGIVPDESMMSTPYWKEILPLASKLNKMTSLVEDYFIDDQTNEDEWFT